jgi:DNA-binding MarR family transcriptional regulator
MQPSCVSLSFSVVTESSTAPYLFGDLLALARQSWVQQMADRLSAVGYDDYRRSDAAVVRLLRRRAAPVGELAGALGVTRQAARKLATGLEQRGYASTVRDPADGRRVNVALTPAGQRYATAVVEVIMALNTELADRVDPAQLVAADAVLRAAIAGGRGRRRSQRLVRPPAGATPADATRPAGLRSLRDPE